MAPNTQPPDSSDNSAGPSSNEPTTMGSPRRGRSRSPIRHERDNDIQKKRSDLDDEILKPRTGSRPNSPVDTSSAPSSPTAATAPAASPSASAAAPTNATATAATPASSTTADAAAKKDEGLGEDSGLGISVSATPTPASVSVPVSAPIPNLSAAATAAAAAIAATGPNPSSVAVTGLDTRYPAAAATPATIPTTRNITVKELRESLTSASSKLEPNTRKVLEELLNEMARLWDWGEDSVFDVDTNILTQLKEGDAKKSEEAALSITVSLKTEIEDTKKKREERDTSISSTTSPAASGFTSPGIAATTIPIASPAPPPFPNEPLPLKLREVSASIKELRDNSHSINKEDIEKISSALEELRKSAAENNITDIGQKTLDITESVLQNLQNKSPAIQAAAAEKILKAIKEEQKVVLENAGKLKSEKQKRAQEAASAAAAAAASAVDTKSNAAVSIAVPASTPSAAPSLAPSAATVKTDSATTAAASTGSVFAGPSSNIPLTPSPPTTPPPASAKINVTPTSTPPISSTSSPAPDSKTNKDPSAAASTGSAGTSLTSPTPTPTSFPISSDSLRRRASSATFGYGTVSGGVSPTYGAAASSAQLGVRFVIDAAKIKDYLQELKKTFTFNNGAERLAYNTLSQEFFEATRLFGSLHNGQVWIDSKLWEDLKNKNTSQEERFDLYRRLINTLNEQSAAKERAKIEVDKASAQAAAVFAANQNQAKVNVGAPAPLPAQVAAAAGPGAPIPAAPAAGDNENPNANAARNVVVAAAPAPAANVNAAVVAAPAAVAAAPAPVPAAQNQHQPQGMHFGYNMVRHGIEALADLPAIDPQLVANGQLNRATPEQFHAESQRIDQIINSDRKYTDAGITSTYDQGILKVFDERTNEPEKPVLERSLIVDPVMNVSTPKIKLKNPPVNDLWITLLFEKNRDIMPLKMTKPCRNKEVALRIFEASLIAGSPIELDPADIRDLNSLQDSADENNRRIFQRFNNLSALAEGNQLDAFRAHVKTVKDSGEEWALGSREIPENLIPPEPPMEFRPAR